MNLFRALLVCCMLATPALADNWPQWRGPKNDGISAETGLPTEWSETKNVVWKLAMPGMGSSTPCIWDDKIFLTSGTDMNELVGMCIGTDGKEIWRKTLGKGGGAAKKDEGNNASPSPSTDGKHVWFCFGSGDVVCCDFAGAERWKFNAQERYGKFRYGYGMHSTPVLHEGKLYLMLLHDGGQNVICVDATTGNDVWKVNRESDGQAECLHSYASPFIWSNGSSALLVTHGNDYAIAHDLKDGKEVWRVGDLNGPDNRNRRTFRFVSSPICTPDLIVIPTAKNGPVVAINPKAHGKVNADSKDTIWRQKVGTPDVPSPIVYDGLVYIVRENGFLQCWDAKTGAIKYTEQRLGAGRYRACPVVADGKVYAVGRDNGLTTVVKAGPKFDVVGENRLSDTFAASPVIADGRIYLRGMKTLYAIATK